MFISKFAFGVVCDIYTFKTKKEMLNIRITLKYNGKSDVD